MEPTTVSILSDASREGGRARVTLFCSTAENIGQTTTLVNVALVLAESGQRVLVLDTRRSEIRAFHYLNSLADGAPGAASPGPGSTGAVWPPGSAPPVPAPWDITLHGRPLRVDLLTFDDVPALTGLDASLLDRYDDVLIDAPVPRTDEELTVLAALPHILATCFPLNSWRVESAAALARKVRQRATGQVGVLAVGLRADSRMYDQLRTARALVRECFEELSDGAGAHYVEFPYEALYAQSDRLAVQEELPGTEDGLRPRFVQLADELARTQPVALNWVSLLHTPRHLAWAEWIEAQLASCGVEVSRGGFDTFTGEPPQPGSMLLALSPLGVDRAKASLLADLSHPDVRMVLVDEEALPREFSHHEQIVMRHISEAEAVIGLQSSLHLPGCPPLSGPAPRFPRMPHHNNLWPRNNGFVGRDALFEEIRATLAAAADSGSRGLLLGQPGIGKSQIALEFCHRFRGDYDLVWWVPGDGPQSVRRGLTALAERLGLPTVGDPVPRVLAHLSDECSGDWLLVYDDVRNADELTARNLLPTSRSAGHVLITGRPMGRLPSGHVVEVVPFSAKESRALLSSSVPGLPRQQSERIGQTVGHLPLTVGLAAAWLEVDSARHEAENRSRDEAVQRAADRFDEDFATAQAELLAQEPEVPLPRVVLEVAIRSIGLTDAARAWAQEYGGGSALEWVLECCALLTGAGAELSLLRSPQMLWALAHRTGGAAGPVDPAAMVSDELMVDVALWALARLGLIEVDFARPARPVRMHQVLREAVLSRMGAAEREVRERELRAVVGGYSPGDPAEQGSGPAVGQNGQGAERRLSASQTGQLTALRIWEDQRTPVQRWLLDHLAVLTRSDDELRLREALDLGRRAERAWAGRPTSAEYLRLQTLLARALRNVSQYLQASRHARVALRGYRASYGTHHPRTLLCSDAYGAILRADGHFTDALFEGRHVFHGMLALLGPQHRATDQVEHNLALSEALAGDARLALQLLQDQFNRRRAIGGPDDPRAWQIANTLAGTHRALGQNRESSDLLRDFLGYRSAVAPSAPPDSDVLRAENGLAVSERRLGRSGRAHERDCRVLANCLRYLGERHIVTLRTRYSLAIDLYELGKHEAATQESAVCLRMLTETLGGEHPYAHLCRIRHAVHLRAGGRTSEALEQGRIALTQLEARLGYAHPWKLAAGSSLAGTLAVIGELEEAAELEETTLEGFDELGLTQHPYRELVARNLAVLDAAVGTGSRTDDLLRSDIDLELPGAV